MRECYRLERLAKKETGFVYGVVKPHDIFIYQDNAGHIIQRLTDFGYSSQTKENALIPLPLSFFWTAPEITYRSVSVESAVKSDIYSNGCICMWTILNNKLAGIFSKHSDSLIGRNGLPWKPTPRGYQISIHVPADLAFDVISQWDTENLPALAQQLLATTNDLDLERRDSLATFFNLSVNYFRDKRSPKLSNLIELLSRRRSGVISWSSKMMFLIIFSMLVSNPIRNDELEEERGVFTVHDNYDLSRRFINKILACKESHLPLQYALPPARAHL